LSGLNNEDKNQLLCNCQNNEFTVIRDSCFLWVKCTECGEEYPFQLEKKTKPISIYGYDLVGEKLVVNKEEAERVKQIFRMYERRT